jgi:HSP20 family protein
MLLTRRNQLTIDPVREFIDAFNRDFGAGFDSAQGSHGIGSGGEMGFPMDILESNGELVIRSTLPGFRKEEIGVHLQNGVLTIEARRVEEKSEDSPARAAGKAKPGDEQFYRRERWEGTVVRRVELPTRFVDTEPKAELRDGVLTLRFPESPASKPRQISIG